MATVDSNTPFDRPGGKYWDSGNLSPPTFGKYLIVAKSVRSSFSDSVMIKYNARLSV